MNPIVKTPNLDRKPSSLRYYQEGPPKSVDLNTWRLSVTGLVDKKIEFYLSRFIRDATNRRKQKNGLCL